MDFQPVPYPRAKPPNPPQNRGWGYRKVEIEAVRISEHYQRIYIYIYVDMIYIYIFIYLFIYLFIFVCAYICIRICTQIKKKTEKWYDRINDCGGAGGKTQAIQTTSSILCAVEAHRFKQGWKMDDRSSGAMINSFFWISGGQLSVPKQSKTCGVWKLTLGGVPKSYSLSINPNNTQ